MSRSFGKLSWSTVMLEFNKFFAKSDRAHLVLHRTSWHVAGSTFHLNALHCGIFGTASFRILEQALWLANWKEIEISEENRGAQDEMTHQGISGRCICSILEVQQMSHLELVLGKLHRCANEIESAINSWSKYNLHRTLWNQSRSKWLNVQGQSLMPSALCLLST